ncbi:MAG: SIMPL domain-containing protein [Vicinamibacterales bacterium]
MVTRTLLALILVAVASSAAAQTPPTPPAQPTSPTSSSFVVARGTATITLAPDQAWLNLSVQTRDPKGPEARRLAATAMTSVMATLKSTGLAADAIKTIGYSLNPDYEYPNGRQRLRGFVVNNQLQIRIDDIDKVTDVIDAATSLTLPASSSVSVGGLRFDVKSRKAAERDALRMAVEDALASARAMAEGARSTIGRVLVITEGVNDSPELYKPMPAMMAGRAGDVAVSTPIEAGDIEIRAWVSVSVEIR